MNFQEIANSADQRIIFVHVATNTVVSYPAFLTEYSDTYSVGWGEERVYGRMDAIKPYVGTTRNVSIAFDVVSDSIENARENFLKYSVLTQMLYPVYGEPLKEGGTRGRTLKAPPLLRVKFVNLVSNSAPRSDDLGLLGCISGLTFNPNRDMGFFVESNGDLLPKVYEWILFCNATVKITTSAFFKQAHTYISLVQLIALIPSLSKKK